MFFVILNIFLTLAIRILWWSYSLAATKIRSICLSAWMSYASYWNKRRDNHCPCLWIIVHIPRVIIHRRLYSWVIVIYQRRVNLTISHMTVFLIRIIMSWLNRWHSSVITLIIFENIQYLCLMLIQNQIVHLLLF